MPKRATVVWTKPALDSLLDIIRYIRRDNPAALQRLAGLSGPRPHDWVIP